MPDESQFLRLFIQHEEALRAYARVLLPDWNAVDDAIQEASVVMWKKLDQLDDYSNFLPWAKVVVRYEALKVRTALHSDRHVFSEAVMDALAQEAAEVTSEEWEAERKAIQSCLKEMPNPKRELLLASFSGHGLIKKLAEQSGKTPNSLYKVIGRLREKIEHCVSLKLELEEGQS